MIEAVEEQRSIPQRVLDELLATKLLSGSARRKLAGYGACYLRDRMKAPDFPEKEKLMLLRMADILYAIEQHGLDDAPGPEAKAPASADTPEALQQLIDGVDADSHVRHVKHAAARVKEGMETRMVPAGTPVRWKVPFRQVYCDGFRSWLRATFWCYVVIKVFPRARETETV